MAAQPPGGGRCGTAAGTVGWTPGSGDGNGSLVYSSANCPWTGFSCEPPAPQAALPEPKSCPTPGQRQAATRDLVGRNRRSTPRAAGSRATMSPTSQLGNRQRENKMCLQLPDLALFLGRCWQPNSVICAQKRAAETLWVSQCWQQAGEQKMIPVTSRGGNLGSAQCVESCCLSRAAHTSAERLDTLAEPGLVGDRRCRAAGRQSRC